MLSAVLATEVPGQMRYLVALALILIVHLFCAAAALARDTAGLFPSYGEVTSATDLWGFINREGKLVVKPTFAEAGSFVDGVARVMLDGKWGFIDPSGKRVVEPKFSSVAEFSEGLACVESDGKAGFIDKTGKFVISPQFEPIEDQELADGVGFSGGLCAVRLKGKFGFIDKTGKMLIAPQFESVRNFQREFTAKIAQVVAGTKTGYIDASGKMVLETPSRLELHEGLACARINGKYGFIDPAVKVVIRPEYQLAGRFSEGLACVKINDKYGYINKSGVLTIPARFSDGHMFHEGLACVRDGIHWGFIDKTGKLVVPAMYDMAGDFQGGLACVKKAERWGVVDKQGKTVLPSQSDWGPVANVPPMFFCDRAYVQFSDGVGFIDRSGTLLANCMFNAATPFTVEKMAAVETMGKWGFIDTRGKFIVEPSFSRVSLGRISSDDAAIVYGFDSQGLRAVAVATPFGQMYRQAIDCIEQGDFSGAINLLKKCAEQRPELAAVYGEMADCYWRTNKHTEAIEQFNRLLALDSSNVKAYVERAAQYQEIGDSVKSAADVQKALSLSPHVDDAYVQQGNQLGAAGRFGDAIDCFSRAILLNPRNVAAFTQRGLVLHTVRDYGRAIEDFTTWIKFEPKSEFAYISRAECYRLTANYDKAIADATKALELDPTDFHAFATRGAAYCGIAQYQKSIEDCTKAEGMEPRFEFTLRTRAAAYFGLKQYESAIKDGTAAIELNPEDARAFDYRGRAYLATGQYQKSVDDFSRALELDPKDWVPYYNRAAAYRKLGEFERAAADQSVVMQVDTTPAMRLARAQDFLAAGKHREAFVDFAYSLAPYLWLATLAVVLVRECIGLAGANGLIARKCGRQFFWRVYALVLAVTWAFFIPGELIANRAWSVADLFMIPMVMGAVTIWRFAFRKEARNKTLHVWKLVAVGYIASMIYSGLVSRADKLTVALVEAFLLPGFVACLLYGWGRLNGGTQPPSEQTDSAGT